MRVKCHTGACASNGFHCSEFHTTYTHSIALCGDLLHPNSPKSAQKYDTIQDIYDMTYDMIWYMMIWYMIWYDIWYDMIWYDIWHDMIWYMIWHMIYYTIWYNIWNDMVRYDIFNCNWVTTLWQQHSTQLHTINTQNNTIHQLGRVRTVPRLCELYTDIRLTTEEKARKNSVRVAGECQLKKDIHNRAYLSIRIHKHNNRNNG